MDTFRFLKFEIYNHSKKAHREINKITKRFPGSYRYLIDQLRRAILSVCLNIAEGSAKSSDKDFARYLQNSIGSVNEAVACLDICLNEGLITEDEYRELTEDLEKIARQIGSFIKKLRISSNS